MGGIPDYYISGQVLGYFSRWFGQLDISTNILCSVDETIRPRNTRLLYWHNAVLHMYPYLLDAQRAMSDMELTVRRGGGSDSFGISSVKLQHVITGL